MQTGGRIKPTSRDVGFFFAVRRFRRQNVCNALIDPHASIKPESCGPS